MLVSVGSVWAKPVEVVYVSGYYWATVLLAHGVEL